MRSIDTMQVCLCNTISFVSALQLCYVSIRLRSFKVTVHVGTDQDTEIEIFAEYKYEYVE